MTDQAEKGVSVAQILAWVKSWFSDRREPVHSDWAALGELEAILTSYPALREEAEALREENEGMKLRIALDADTIKLHLETIVKAERELAEARPVIEAARKFIAIEGDAPRQVVDRLGLSNKIVELAVEAARAALDKREEPK